MVTLPGEDAIAPLPDHLPRRMGVGAWQPEVIQRDTSQLGQGLENAGQGLALYNAGQQRQQTQGDNAAADSAYQVKSIDLRNQAGKTTDPTQLSDINDQLQQAHADSMGMFSGGPSSRAASAWDRQNQPRLAADQGQIGNIAWGLNRSTDLANKQQQLQSLHDAGLSATTDADKEGVIRNAGAIYDSSVAAGYMTPADAIKAKQAFAQNYAINSIKQMSPGQQLSVLRPVNTGGASKQAFSYLTSQGWSPDQASGIVGNLIHESGLDPTKVNPGDGADGSDSIGIGQWNGQRAEQLKAFAAAQGKSWQDMPTQLAFIQHELQTSESNAGSAIKQAQTPQDAAAAALQYERPSGYEHGPEAASGWQNRLRQTQGVYSAFAKGQEPPLIPGAHLAAFVPEDVRAGLAETASRNIDASNREEGATVKSLIQDDQSQIMNTGQPIQDLTPDRVAATMGPDAAARWQQSRGLAQNYYNQTHDWDQLPENQIYGRLSSLEPKAGTPGFADAQAYYESADKKATAMINQRYQDPAGAVDQLPGVQAAKQNIDQNDPTSFLPTVKARLTAQDAMGIPAGAQSPITDTEAKRYASVLQPVSRGQADTQNQNDVINSVVNDVNAKYGPYAQQAMSRVLYHVTMKTDAADVLSAAMQNYKQQQSGPLVSPDDARKVQIEQNAAKAKAMASPLDLPMGRALVGAAVNAASTIAPFITSQQPQQKPFWQAVDLLRSDPDRMLQPFIQRFGVDSVPSDLRDKLQPSASKNAQ